MHSTPLQIQIHLLFEERREPLVVPTLARVFESKPAVVLVSSQASRRLSQCKAEKRTRCTQQRQQEKEKGTKQVKAAAVEPEQQQPSRNNSASCRVAFARSHLRK